MKAGTTSGAMVVLVVVLVARRAHNPKVAGSNPAPATNEVKCKPWSRSHRAGSGAWSAPSRQGCAVGGNGLTAPRVHEDRAGHRDLRLVWGGRVRPALAQSREGTRVSGVRERASLAPSG